jgi:hypothetical protein
MSRRLVAFVGVIHNTAEFPYQLAADIAHWAQVSGKFNTVKCLSYRAPFHRMLLPLAVGSAAVFHPAYLSQQMPWSDATKPKNRTKYASTFIEASEAIEIGVSNTFLDHAFRAEIRHQLDGLPLDTKVLFVLTDVRSVSEVATIRELFTSVRGIFVRAMGNADSRKNIKCAELDQSILESFYRDVDPSLLAFSVDNTSPLDDLEAINGAVLTLLDDKEKKTPTRTNINEVD